MRFDAREFIVQIIGDRYGNNTTGMAVADKLRCLIKRSTVRSGRGRREDRTFQNHSFNKLYNGVSDVKIVLKYCPYAARVPLTFRDIGNRFFLYFYKLTITSCVLFLTISTALRRDNAMFIAEKYIQFEVIGRLGITCGRPRFNVVDFKLNIKR